MTGRDECHGFNLLNPRQARDASSSGWRTLVATGSASTKDRTLFLCQARCRYGGLRNAQDP